VQFCRCRDFAAAECAQVHPDFHAETALEAVIQFLLTHGRPKQMSFDHDPRWVGGSSGWDFPSALKRFLLCVQIEPRICPPHQPQKNAYVERYHRSYKEECLHAWLARNGCVTVHHETYYLSTQLVGQLVALVVDAPSASFDVMVGEQLLKRLPIKGVVREELPLERFMSLMLEQARSEERLRQALKARWQRHPWDPTP
jgi:transposase InsO family protein